VEHSSANDTAAAAAAPAAEEEGHAIRPDAFGRYSSQSSAMLMAAHIDRCKELLEGDG
jgi:hypothetical protein